MYNLQLAELEVPPIKNEKFASRSKSARLGAAIRTVLDVLP